MASSKVIGGPLDKGVTNQLDIRSKVLSSGYRDNFALQYMSAKTGWVKMSSSVLVESNDDLAKKYILLGGTSGRSGSLTYSNFTEGKGFRPMPGITGVNIKSINKFGLLKEATITYNCWDVSQLQELEILFMRPGYSVLLEWGHSLYYTTETNWEKVPMTVSNFFTPGTTKQMVYAEIEKLKKESGYNYDAIYGFIKNFSWSFRADGGYDCTTTLTSIGEIIESLQIDIDNPGLGNPPPPPAGSSESSIEGYSLGDRPKTLSDTSEKGKEEEKEVEIEKGGILFVGDSVTADNNWKNGVAVEKVTFTYSALIRKHYGGKHAVDVLAIGGKRMNDWMIVMLPMVLKVHTYDIVFIYGGINDAFALRPVDEMIENCQKMVDMVNASGGKPIVILGYDAKVFMNSEYYQDPKAEKLKEPSILVKKLMAANSKVTKEQIISMRANYIEYQKLLPTRLKNCTYVPMFPIEKSSSGDAVHPGPKEHQKWKATLVNIIDTALPPK
jgi:lysophospholipase L1-like esterase